MQKFLMILIVLFCNALHAQNQEALDSIIQLRQLSQNNTYDLQKRLEFAERASYLSQQSKVDSTILLSNRNLSLLYFHNNKLDDYIEINRANLNLARQLNDSSALAAATHNIAGYYHLEAKIDSAFYYYLDALKIYDKLQNVRKEAKVLLHIADIQETEKDYFGSEENAIKAIKLLNTLKIDESIKDDLWILNNLLGIISLKLKLYDKSLEYHNKALKLADNMQDGYYNTLYSLNNQAFVYREKGDYKKALDLYQQTLADGTLSKEDPEFYALIVGNIAYTKFLINGSASNEVETLFSEAYSLSDRLNDPITKLGVAKDFAKYFLATEQRDSAYKYANISYQLSKETSSNEIQLEALLLLSKLTEGEERTNYLNRHIKLSDSLLDVERSTRNKYARIAFETDQIIAENEQISKERLVFLLSSIGLLVTLILLYVIITQRIKNKELEFNRAQQEANEEIYNLMLAQQDKVDEGRTQEKKRISEELHDGVLGRLFGTRLSLDSLNFVNTEEAVKTRGQYIEELKSIEQEIRKISHDLNSDFVSGSSFSDILKTLIETQTKAYQLSYDYYEDDEIDWDDLSNRTKIHVYRMLQETMQNIYKHAHANHIKISFQLKNNVILLTVEDDGAGFNTNKARKGIGLKNFDSRANDIGGKVEIFSKPGQGTKVHIHVPTE